LKARQVQDWKVTLGNDLQKAFGQEVTTGTVDAKQALRRGMRTALGQKIPEVAAVNQELGPMYAVQDAMQRRALTYGNTDPVSHGTQMGSIVGGIMGMPVVGAAAGYVARHPAIMGNVAGKLYRTGAHVDAMGKGLLAASHAVRPGLASADDALREALLQAMASGDQP